MSKSILVEDVRCPTVGSPQWHLTESGWRAPVARPLLTERVVYVRPGGDDALDGSSVLLAVATLRRALELVPNYFEDRRWVIDITGCNDVSTTPDSWAAKVSSLLYWQNAQLGGAFGVEWIDPALPAFPGDFARSALTIRATPTTLYSGVAVTANTPDPCNTLIAATTDGNYALNELQGKIVYDSSYGVPPALSFPMIIVGNTAGPNSILYLASDLPLTGPLTICDYGADITMGVVGPTDFNNPNRSTLQCSFLFQGVRLHEITTAPSGYAPSISYFSGTFQYFVASEIQGITAYAPEVNITACYLYSPSGDGSYQGDVTFGADYSYFRKISDAIYAGGGAHTRCNVYENCGPAGHSGWAAGAYGWFFEHYSFINPQTPSTGAPGPAISHRSPGVLCRVKDTTITGGTYGVISNLAGSYGSAGQLVLNNVRGAVGTAGIYLGDGVQLQLINMSDALGVHGPGNERIVLGSTGRLLNYTAAGTTPFFCNELFWGDLTTRGKRVAVPPTNVAITAAADAIAVGGSSFVPFQSNGVYTLVSTPTIADGVDGEEIILYNNGGSAVTLQDQGTLPGSNLRLTAAGVTIADRQSIRLTFVAAVGDWIQTGNLVAVI